MSNVFLPDDPPQATHQVGDIFSFQHGPVTANVFAYRVTSVSKDGKAETTELLDHNSAEYKDLVERHVTTQARNSERDVEKLLTKLNEACTALGSPLTEQETADIQVEFANAGSLNESASHARQGLAAKYLAPRIQTTAARLLTCLKASDA